LSVGSNFAVSDRLFVSLSSSGILDSAGKSGFGFSLAGAYRGERWSVLSHSAAELGEISRTGDNFTGDTRLSWLLDDGYDLRLGYAYRWLVGERYLELISLGSSLYAWEGGNLLLQGRLFHDWSSGDLTLGAGLEVSQRLGCGVYGVAGYNLGGLNRDYGSVYGGAGAFIRLDVVFDEEWRCGRLFANKENDRLEEIGGESGEGDSQ
jgi:hypothetical protein